MLAAALLVLAETNEWGRKYLEKNRFRKEFVTLPSGLQYRSVEEGGGKRHPTPDTECLCHYEGRTAFQYEPGKRRWQTFDSSAHALCLREHSCRPLALLAHSPANTAPRLCAGYKRKEPSPFTPNGVIAGWREALLLMVEGDKWELVIPSELAYGDESMGPHIKPGDILFFTLELVKINGATTAATSRLKELPAAVELTSLAHYHEWAEDARPPMILGVFRKPVYGQKLLGGLRNAQTYLAQAGGAACAFYAQSHFDGKTNQYTSSELEDALQLTAPNIYTSMGDIGSGTKWTLCEGVHLKKVETQDDVQRAIVSCARAAEKEEL
jgi:FKBP-type peptidyl-prolyl cis-trans isomerase FklB